MNQFIKKIVVLACFLGQVNLFSTDREEIINKNYDTQMKNIEKTFGNLEPAAKVQGIAEYLSQRPSDLLMFAEKIADPKQWFGTFRATGLEGAIMRAVMLAYGLPMPVDYEESLWGKKEHMRDAIFLAMSKHKDFNKTKNNDEQEVRSYFERISKYGLTIKQVVNSKKIVEEMPISFSNMMSIGELPVAPSGLSQEYLSRPDTLGYRFKSWASNTFIGDAEKNKKRREYLDNTLGGKVQRFFGHAGGTLGTLGAYAGFRLWFVADANRSAKMMEMLSEAIVANYEKVSLDIPKEATLEQLQAHANTTPLEALLNYVNLSRNRLKNIDGLNDRVAKAGVVDLCFYLSFTPGFNVTRALRLVGDALKASATSQIPRARVQFVAIANSCAKEIGLFEDEVFKPAMNKHAIFNSVSEALGITPQASLKGKEYLENLRIQIAPKVKEQFAGVNTDSLGVIQVLMADPLFTLEQSPYKNAAPFFIDMKRMMQERKENKPLTDGIYKLPAYTGAPLQPASVGAVR